jgi:putative glycosyltransferase (TIGR04372 family)
MAPILFPTIIIVRLLRPVLVFRFGQLATSRIGHLALDTELYLCERDAGADRKPTVDFFYHASPVSNQQLKKLWNRRLRVSWLARYLDTVNRAVPGSELHSVRLRRNASKDIHGIIAKTGPRLRFNQDENRQAMHELKTIGIPEGAEFICFTARDSAYLSSWQPDRQWDYHDYRNCSVLNFIPAAEELVKQGYFAIRMGAVVGEALGASNPMVIDYASEHRTDFLDIYLAANCRFFLTSGTGIDSVATIFRRPVAYANYIPIGYFPSWGPDDLFVPKKLWLAEENRFMKFRQVLDWGAQRLGQTQDYQGAGIEPVENTPEEITAVAMEMDERLKGTWRITKEDEELQSRFWSLFKPHELEGVSLPNVGAEFLRQNKDLLD